MKCILLTSNYPYGGASANLLRYFTFCLKNTGHEVEVFLPTGAFYGNKVDQQSVRKGVINGIKYKRLGFIYHPKNFIGKFFDIILGLFLPFFFLLHRKLTKRLDIIIIYNPRLSTLLFYLLTKVLLSKKLIIIVPEFYERPNCRFFSLSTLKYFDFYLGIKYFYKYADKFIVLSEYLKNYLALRCKSGKRIFIMPNLIDPERFNFKNVMPFRSGLTTIGYVGTPTRKDGILDLIKSFSIINRLNCDTHLLIIGDITNGNTLLPELKRYAYGLGIPEDTITFKGLTSHVEIPRLLLSCQILALTRPKGVFAEAGFPTKLGEYFACKKPVVITRVGDMKNYFTDKKEVVFAEPENIQSIVSAFEYLITNPEERVNIGLNGFYWMDEKLNYKNQAQIISDFIDITNINK